MKYIILGIPSAKDIYSIEELLDLEAIKDLREWKKFVNNHQFQDAKDRLLAEEFFKAGYLLGKYAKRIDQ